jgi:hypothetical protein
MILACDCNSTGGCPKCKSQSWVYGEVEDTEKITKEDEIKFYKKVFETKNED